MKHIDQELIVKLSGADEVSPYTRMLVAGHPGSGKTRFALTFPDPLFVDCNSGLTTLGLRPGTPFVEVGSESDLHLLREYLDRSSQEREEVFGFPVETLVIDTVDEFQRRLLANRLAESRSEVPSKEDWQWLGMRCSQIFSGLASLEMNVVLNVHVKQEAFDDQYWWKPGVQGAFTDQINQFVDYAVFIEPLNVSVEETEALAINGIDMHVSLAAADMGCGAVLLSRPTREIPWLKDYSGTLPNEFLLNFTDDYDRLSLLRKVVLDGPESKTLNILPPAVTALLEEVKSEAEGQTGPETVSEIGTESVLPPCTECGKIVESRDWLDLSALRFQQAFCKSCYSSKTNI